MNTSVPATPVACPEGGLYDVDGSQRGAVQFVRRCEMMALLSIRD